MIPSALHSVGRGDGDGGYDGSAGVSAGEEGVAPVTGAVGVGEGPSSSDAVYPAPPAKQRIPINRRANVISIHGRII